MKFMLKFTWGPDAQARAARVERFRNTGGLPPAGVTLLGRWTRADLSGGFILLETDDAKQLTKFAYGWSDLLTVEIIPVIEDHDLSEVFQGAARQSA